jgi:hypothetical protein
MRNEWTKGWIDYNRHSAGFPLQLKKDDGEYNKLWRHEDIIGDHVAPAKPHFDDKGEVPFSKTRLFCVVNLISFWKVFVLKPRKISGSDKKIKLDLVNSGRDDWRLYSGSVGMTLQANAWIEPRVGHDHFHKNTFQFIIYKLSYHSMLCGG